MELKLDMEIALPEYTLAKQRRAVADAQLEKAREGKLGIAAGVVEVS